MTTKDTADQWGITPRQIQLLCAQGRVPGAIRFSHAWVIPVDAKNLRIDAVKRKTRMRKGNHDYWRVEK